MEEKQEHQEMREDHHTIRANMFTGRNLRFGEIISARYLITLEEKWFGKSIKFYNAYFL